MRDIIDERDEKERISKSIIKYWNVNYVPVPQQEDETQKILQQLEEEAVREEAAKRAEIDAALEAAKRREDLYNVTTGSYSGSYGSVEVQDEVTKGQIDKILQEKTEALRSIIENGSQENEKELPPQF